MTRLSPRILAALLVTIAVLRIVPTYRVFSATVDEATHVGAGMELYQHHQYQLQRANPPIARAVVGVAPVLGGMRFTPSGDYGAALHSVFYGPGLSYERRMVLSRAGNLLFVILAAVALFVCVRGESDAQVAVMAVFLFTFEPVILGHSGLATNDAAATAGLALSLLAFTRWLRQPTRARAALLALAWTFAILCKFSNLAFVPLACLGFGLFRVRETGRRAATLLVIPLLVPLAIWAGYAFTVGKLADLGEVQGGYGPAFERFVIAHPSLPLPAPGFFYGLAHIRLIDAVGHLSYFRGEASKTGWALYFPATIALKTTLALLLFIAAGFWFARRAPAPRRLMLQSLAAATLMAGLAMRSHLDLGIRYILPVFVPLSICAAAGAMAMLRAGRTARLAAALVIGWHLAASLLAHPDYFPYFNFLAGRDPSRILVDSNLDWGQDALRLRRELRRKGVPRVGLAVAGGADFNGLGYPPNYALDPLRPSTGWVAVSDHMLRMDGAVFGGWRWLADAKFERVGKSIRLYDFPAGAFDAYDAARPSRGLILLPIAGTAGDLQFPYGLRWRIRQQVTNLANERQHIVTNACARTMSCAFDLAPGQTVAMTPPPGRPPYVVLHADPRVAAQLRTWTVVERTDAAAHGFRVAIPEVRERDFASRAIAIRGVPISLAYRLNLRVWALNASRVPLTITIASGGNVLAEKTLTSDADGYLSDGDLIPHVFPELPRNGVEAEITITVDAGDPRIWAFITATSNETNLPRILLP